jgi:hypothetical protein
MSVLRVRVRVTLRLTVYRQSVRLGAKPLVQTAFLFSLGADRIENTVSINSSIVAIRLAA